MAIGCDKVIWSLYLLLSDFSFTNICQFWYHSSLYCYIARESLQIEDKSLIGHWYGRCFLWLHAAADKWLFPGHWCLTPWTFVWVNDSMFCQRTDKWKWYITVIISAYWEISLTLLYSVKLNPQSFVEGNILKLTHLIFGF